MRPVIIIGAIVLGAAVVAVVGSNHSASAIKVVMGQRFFPDGTGVAFFDDGTTQTFFHSVTPRNGYYYDNSTVFFAGMIPGFNETFITINPSLLGTNDKFSYTPYYDDNNSTNFTDGSSGSPYHNTTTIRIPNGFTLQPGAQKFQPNIVRVHPGDIVT
jgi:hypothetical protein